jgi:hypothetical protein
MLVYIRSWGGLQYVMEGAEGTDYAKAGERLVSEAGVRTRGWTVISGVGEAFSS